MGEWYVTVVVMRGEAADESQGGDVVDVRRMPGEWSEARKGKGSL